MRVVVVCCLFVFVCSAVSPSCAVIRIGYVCAIFFDVRLFCCCFLFCCQWGSEYFPIPSNLIVLFFAILFYLSAWFLFCLTFFSIQPFAFLKLFQSYFICALVFVLSEYFPNSLHLIFEFVAILFYFLPCFLFVVVSAVMLFETKKTHVFIRGLLFCVYILLKYNIQSLFVGFIAHVSRCACFLCFLTRPVYADDVTVNSSAIYCCLKMRFYG